MRNIIKEVYKEVSKKLYENKVEDPLKVLGQKAHVPKKVKFTSIRKNVKKYDSLDIENSKRITIKQRSENKFDEISNSSEGIRNLNIVNINLDYQL